MYYVYIIKNESGRFYIGMTSNIVERLRHHNSGANRSTKNKGPWKIVYSEEFEDKKSAFFRERKIKSYKGGDAFKKLIGEIA